mgnify:CR=1 FL=1
MKSKKIYFLLLPAFFIANLLNAQIIKGNITADNKPASYSNLFIKETDLIYKAKIDGTFIIDNSPLGNQIITVQCLGMRQKEIAINVKKGINTININLEPLDLSLDEVVVTATKTFKRKTESPVIVNVIDNYRLQTVQACNLAEGLNFQSGIRVETDCQTCNYTQLRINGLAGGYSQILINSRSIFSPLTALYGMEQIPSNMIEKIEIVRGGGSALYGSSAIAGVVNIITKLPLKNEFNFGIDYGTINSFSEDMIINGNATVLSKSKNAGATFFVNNRIREPYDHNGDNYSELSKLKNSSIGMNLFLQPDNKQKIELNLSKFNEYRYGGEITDFLPHYAMQSEERIHDVNIGNIDYNINFNNGFSSLNTYIAFQNTNREHYTGIRPQIGTPEDTSHILNPPYGSSVNTTSQIGLQLNHEYNKFLGFNMFTIGSEFIFDYVLDEIPAYSYLIDQRVKNLGIFLQSDWYLTENTSLLSGIRFDKNSFLNNFVVSPRVSFLYKIKDNTQFRISYSTGFRAPQAFDADLHIAFAGGGISRIELSDDLIQERSKSFSGSLNYDLVRSNYLFGFTIEGFFTRIEDVFYYTPLGEDQFGEVFEKNNANGAVVRGATFELRTKLFKDIQFETGLTLQSSLYDDLIIYSNELEGRDEFLRTPNNYGFASFSYKLSNQFYLSSNLVYTGKMHLLHLGGSPEQEYDSYKQSEIFNVIGAKLTYVQNINRVGVSLDYSIGVKNLTNSYQQDFDTSKNRDSNYIYGPSYPRTIYFSIDLKSINN